MSSQQVKYNVFAKMNKTHMDEYLHWLNSGHMHDVLRQGNATDATIVLHDSDDSAVGPEITIEVSYTFPTRGHLDAYLSGPALVLRLEGKALWMDTNKGLLF